MSQELFQAPTLEELAPLFPNYSIDAFIAQGGMGAVYLGTQLSLERPVAIKILPRHLGADEEFRSSFSLEAKAMAKLNHPSLIGVYDFGEADGMPFIVMEYVPGKSLHDSSYGKQIDPAEASRIVSSICRGLDHAHEQNILHRDVKPANILLAQDASPKLGDFGLAMASNSESDGLVYGTPGYAAPEVYAGNPDHRSDIYAAAVMLYEVVTGTLPTEPYLHPSQLANCDPRLDEILSKALQPDPNNRHQSAEELAEELEDFIDNPTASATPLAAASASGISPTRRTSLPSAKKSGTPALAIGAVAVAALGAGAFFLLSSKDDSLPPSASPPSLVEEQPEPEADSSLLVANASAEALDPSMPEEEENATLATAAADEARRQAEAAQAAEEAEEAARLAAEKQEQQRLAAQQAAQQEKEQALAMAAESEENEEAEAPEEELVSTFDHVSFLKRGRDYFRKEAESILGDYEKELAQNIDRLERECRSIVRDEDYISRDTAKLRRENVEVTLNEYRKVGRLPANLATEIPETFLSLTYRTDYVETALKDALNEQSQVELKRQTNLRPLLISYTAGITKQSELLAAEGNQLDADILAHESQITRNDLDRFITILEGEDLPPVDLAKQRALELAAETVVGQWEITSMKKKVVFTFNEDGTAKSGIWGGTGKWKVTDEGYYIKWDTGSGWMNFVQEGKDRMKGTNVKGNKYTFSRVADA